MNEEVISLFAGMGAVICFVIILLQILLVFGKPYGALTMGGKYRILPLPLRVASGISAIILGTVGYLLLQQTEILPKLLPFELSRIILWAFTIFLGVNVLANIASKSRWERIIMTPLALILFVVCLAVSIYTS
ncbi:hypothetical protein [Alkalicoccobacillus porphyridii]|uniref:Uncharacterized protein n=1 Tax=Alkalicoccobacillus porphyridii TaxID=2597270 RepID=A0A553ZXF8_9BACI|nr:hypothetical protein [Alkalicoccobacillus porphyridii]TSB46036.1 hypothetical protein FN960_14145 [Alkalicoccobacillus porphyridii]